MILTSIDGTQVPVRHRTDAELLGDIRAENADALESLFHRYVRLVNGIARRILNDSAEAEDVTQGEQIDTLEERIPDPPPRLSPEECRWVLRSGLAQLPTRQRATLELTCFEDLPLRDVAERLGVSVGCTRHYYYRGLARLRHWARLTDRRPSRECRSGAAAGTTGGARGRDRRLSNRP
jgi:DNA-directed RNA polymerase specialized sigma24 family protein